jgi:hypothetical protein
VLTRLIYHSENHLGPFDGKMIGALNAIMQVAIKNNQKANITGALIFDQLWFLQILEGDRQAVSTTLRRIIADDRHDDLTVMDARPIPDRVFANWWMGIAAVPGGASALFDKHGLGSRFDPRKMSSGQAVAVAMDLAKLGLNRQLAMPTV